MPFGGFFTQAIAGLGISVLTNQLFSRKLPTQEGPRLRDLAIMKSSYGEPLPRVWGKMRVGGRIIWPKSGLVKETKKEETIEKDGGWFAPDVKQTFVTYTYSADLAVALCEGEIEGIGRIWANGKVIYDGATTNPDTEIAGYVNAERVSVYKGSETQDPDSLIESYEGSGNVPAFRGVAYVVFKNLQLGPYDNSVPQLEFEIISSGSTDFPTPLADPLATYSRSGRLVSGAYKESSIEGNYTVSGAGDHYYKIVQTTYNLLDRTVLDTKEIIRSNTIGPAGGSFHAVSIERSWLYSIIGVTNYYVKWVIDGNLGASVSLPTGVKTNPAGYFEESIAADTFKLEGNNAIYLVGSDSAIFDAGVNRYFSTSFIAKYELKPDAAGTGYPEPSAEPEYWIDLNANNLECGNSVEQPSHPISVDIVDGSVWVVNENRASASDYHVAKLSKNLEFIEGWYDLPYGWSASQFDVPGFAVYDSMIAAKGLDTITVTKFNTGGTRTNLGSYTGSTSLYRPLTHVGGPFISGADALLSMSNLVTPSNVTLGSIVSDLCDEVGLSSIDIDVTDLTENVRGYAKTGPMQIRSALEPLQASFAFDVIESDYKVKFIKRGNSPVVSIPASDLACHEQDAEEPNDIETNIQQELELPRICGVRYQDVNASYNQGYQYVERITTESNEELQVELPVAFNGDEARQVADVLLYDAWTQRLTNKLVLSWKYLYLDPTDVITVTDSGGTEYTLRVTKTTSALPGLIELETTTEDVEVYNSSVTGEDLSVDDEVQGSVGASLSLPIDSTALVDADNSTGYYVATISLSGGFGGTHVYESKDSGGSYQLLDTILSEASIGRVTASLGDGYTTVFDYANSITITMLNGAPSSSTEGAVLNGSNRALVGNASIGWELIGYVDVVDNGSGSYTLSTLLRGLRGTEYLTGSHLDVSALGNNEYCVLVDDSLETIADVSGDLDTEVSLKFPPIALPPSNQTPVGFTNTGQRLFPYSPVHLTAYQASANEDVNFTWIRRTRTGGEWNDYSDVPLGEDSEAYELDIIDEGSVIRTISATSESASYSVSEALDDGIVSYNWHPTGTTHDGSHSGFGLSDVRDVFFKPDGTRMYLVEDTSLVYQYDLSTAWDITTETSAGNFTAAGTTTLDGLCFSPDGTKLFVSDHGAIDRFDLSTAWDITTAAATAHSTVSVSGPNEVRISEDGLKLFVSTKGNRIQQYVLGTAFDLSTASLNYQWFIDNEGIAIGPNGKNVALTESAEIKTYDLDTPWEISSGRTYDGEVDISAHQTSAKGIAVSTDGSYAYVCDEGTGTVHYYSLGSEESSATFDATVYQISATVGRGPGTTLEDIQITKS